MIFNLLSVSVRLTEDFCRHFRVERFPNEIKACVVPLFSQLFLAC